MKVVLAGFGMESLTNTAADLKALGAETLIVQTDVSQVEQVEDLAAATVEAFGQVDLQDLRRLERKIRRQAHSLGYDLVPEVASLVVSKKLPTGRTGRRPELPCKKQRSYTVCGIGWRARRPSSHWCAALRGEPVKKLGPGACEVDIGEIADWHCPVAIIPFRRIPVVHAPPHHPPITQEDAGRHRQPFSSLNAHPDLIVSQKKKKAVSTSRAPSSTYLLATSRL